ncbi:MAG: tellurium resistance protein TerC [Lactobacillus sp.]|nr:tellurium resistance protein TerC [Lactobacillus sp.]
MKWYYFLFQLKTFFANPKNIGLYIVTALLALYFGIVSVPNHHVINRVDPYIIRKEYKDDSTFLNVAKKEFAQANKSALTIIPSQGAKNAIETYPTILKYDKKRLAALKREDWRLYTLYSSKWYKYIDYLIFVKENQNFMYPVEYEHNGIYKENGHFGYQRTYHFYTALLTSNSNLNKNILEEKTALQSIQNSLSGWTTLILIMIVIFYTADIFSRDKKHCTVIKNIPLSKSAILWIKTGVVELGVFLDFLMAFIIALACITPKYGLGSLSLKTTFYMGRLYFKVPFTYQTLGMYYLQLTIFVVLITFIFIHLTMLLSLLFRNEYVAEIAATVVAVSGKVLYFSMGMGFVYPILQQLPTTYFTIGDSLSGNLSYMMDSPGWGFNEGITSLLLTILVIEVIIILICRMKKIPLIN